MSNEFRKTQFLKGLAVFSTATCFAIASFAQEANKTKSGQKAKDPATHVDYKSPPAPITQSAARSTTGAASSQNKNSRNANKTKKSKVPADNHQKREMPF